MADKKDEAHLLTSVSWVLEGPLRKSFEEQISKPNLLMQMMMDDPDYVPPPPLTRWDRLRSWARSKWPLCWKKNASEHCDCEVW